MINQFKGKYRWLSNFAPCEIVLDRRKYASVEHAYMSAKSDSLSWKEFCASDVTPGEVKRASRSLSYLHCLVENWDDIRIDVMRECLKQKFSQEPYRTWLRETGNEYIQEGNTWHDQFWGVEFHTGQGENRLGKLIMEIRTIYQFEGREGK